MKTLKIVLITVLLINVSCEGPQGDVGPAGAQGSQGPQGEKGEVGSANVNSTSWTTFDVENGSVAKTTYQNDNDENYYTSVFMRKGNKEMPVLTAEIIDSGLALIYFKLGSRVYNSEKREYEIQERIFGGEILPRANGWIQIPGRDGEIATDFQSYSVVVSSIGENFWDPYISFRSNFKQQTEGGKNTSFSTAPELVDKGNDFYRSLFKELPEYRVITIPAAANGRRKRVDYSDYAKVCEAFGLEL